MRKVLSIMFTIILVFAAIGVLPVAVQAQDSGTIAYGETVEDELEMEGADSWTFEASEGDVVRISVESEAFDAYAEVLDADGVVIASDDDTGELFNALLFVMIEADGTYTINVRDSFDSGEGAYTLTIELAEFTMIEYGGSVDSNLANNEAFAFEGAAGDVVTLRSDSEEFSTSLTLLGPDGFTAYSNYDSNSIDRLLPADGQYIVLVNALIGEEGAFTLTLEPLEVTEAGAINVGDSVMSVLEADSTSEWTFEAAETGIFLVTVGSETFDTTLSVINADGEVVAENDDGGFGTDSRIYLQAEAGTYTVEVAAYSLSAGLYTLSVSEVESETIEPGATVESTLGENGVRVFVFEGAAGDAITLSAESDNFDTVLTMVGPNNFEDFNDDVPEGDTTNSLLTIEELPEDGTYLIVVEAYFEPGETTDFTLSFE